jgi:hypothetical protein
MSAAPERTGGCTAPQPSIQKGFQRFWKLFVICDSLACVPEGVSHTLEPLTGMTLDLPLPRNGQAFPTLRRSSLA